MNKGFVSVLATLLGVITLMSAAATRADEIKVMATPALKGVFLELIPQFEQASGHKVVARFFPSPDILRRAKANESADLVILPGSSVDELIRLGKAVPGSRIDLAKVGVNVAVRAGAPKPEIGSSDAVKRALLAAKSIGYSGGASGVYVVRLFQRMGIADELKTKSKEAPPGIAVGEMVARGEVEIGFHQLSELLPIAGIDILGPLPPDIQETTLFSAATLVSAKDHAVARALVQLLASPAAIAVMKKNGMEPG